MIEAKDLNKHPIRYGTQYLTKLLEQQSKTEIIEQLTFSVREGILIVTCKDDEAYKTLKTCESLMDKDFVRKLGLDSFLFQYDKHYLVLQIINDFAKQGIKEFSLESVFQQVNSYSPARTAQVVKDVLTFFCSDFSEPFRRSSNFPFQIMELRGRKPLIERKKNGDYQLLLKVKTKSSPGTKKGKVK